MYERCALRCWRQLHDYMCTALQRGLPDIRPLGRADMDLWGLLAPKGAWKACCPAELLLRL